MLGERPVPYIPYPRKTPTTTWYTYSFTAQNANWRWGQHKAAQVQSIWPNDRKGRSQDPPPPEPHLRVKHAEERIFLKIPAGLWPSKHKHLLFCFYNHRSWTRPYSCLMQIVTMLSGCHYYDFHHLRPLLFVFSTRHAFVHMPCEPKYVFFYSHYSGHNTLCQQNL